MKFTAQRSDLAKALTKVASAVPPRSTLPILETFLMTLNGDALTLKATDLELSVVAEIQVDGEKDGSIAMPARRFVETIKSINADKVEVETTSDFKITISANGKYKFVGEDPAEFPNIEIPAEAKLISVDGDILRSTFERTTFACSTDELRPAMNGCLLTAEKGTLTVVGVDGYRMGVVTRTIDKSAKFKGVVPRMACEIVAKNAKGDILIGIEGSQFIAKQGGLTIISRLIDEEFPNYKSVIPTEEYKVLKVNAKHLHETLRRVSMFANSTSNQVRMVLSKNNIKATAEDVDFGGEAQEDVVCEYAGEDALIGFDAKYIVEALEHVPLGAELHVVSPTRAIVIVPAEKGADDYLQLVMPQRLNN